MSVSVCLIYLSGVQGKNPAGQGIIAEYPYNLNLEIFIFDHTMRTKI